MSFSAAEQVIAQTENSSDDRLYRHALGMISFLPIAFVGLPSAGMFIGLGNQGRFSVLIAKDCTYLHSAGTRWFAPYTAIRNRK